jgi:hypothetical protein
LHDESDGLTIYEPIPPPGYRALGMVAMKNKLPPPALSAFCVRSDAVRDAQGPPIRQLDDLYSMQPGDVAVSLCAYDRATHALQLRPSGGMRTSFPVLSLPSPEAAQLNTSIQPVTVHMNSSSICVRARNILRVPLLEVETSKLQAEYSLQADGSVSASAFCSPEVWSYNEHLKEWEEVIQKVPLQVCSWLPWTRCQASCTTSASVDCILSWRVPS